RNDTDLQQGGSGSNGDGRHEAAGKARTLGLSARLDEAVRAHADDPVRWDDTPPRRPVPNPAYPVRNFVTGGLTQDDAPSPPLPSADRLRNFVTGGGTPDRTGLACEPDLISAVRRDIRAVGVVGEADNALLVYIAYTSRLLEDPLAIVTRGKTASGKSTLL